MIPLSRNSDPIASHAGADYIEKSGALKDQLKNIHAALKLYPMHTARELARDARLDYYLISKRLTVLERRGLARRHPERICTASKTGLKATVWEAT